MAISSNDGQVYNQIKKLFNLPDSCRRIEIRMEVDSLIEIECEYFPDEGTGETITQQFNVVPVEQETMDVTTLESDAKQYARVPLKDG